MHAEHDDQRQDLSYRYATADDLKRFYGHPPEQTLQAVVILLGDDPVAVIGLAYGKDCATMFSDTKPQILPFIKKMTVLRAIKFAMNLADACGRDVYAIRKEGTDILPRIGFQHFDGDTYKWPFSQRRCRM